MEEVEKFLERCHHSFEQMQHRTRTRAAVERSRSIANILKSTNATTIDNRARSTINLTQDIHKKSGFFGEYNTFKDFTWWVELVPSGLSSLFMQHFALMFFLCKFFFCRRRNHKHKEKKKDKYQVFEQQQQQLQQHHDEPISLPCFDVPSYQSTTVDETDDVDKLSKEAYRLSRTVHNFLNTHEPILSQTISNGHHSVKPPPATVNLKHSKNEMMFEFDHESQISMRSTDESSVHSSSNSSNKEEDDLVQPKISFKNQSKANKIFSSCHQTEDESGFSSMNSFHEVGLPLNSTMLSTNSSSGDEGRNESMREKLKKRNVVSHRKFNSTPLLSNATPKLKLLDDEENSMKVLWVWRNAEHEWNWMCEQCSKPKCRISIKKKKLRSWNMNKMNTSGKNTSFTKNIRTWLFNWSHKFYSAHWVFFSRYHQHIFNIINKARVTRSRKYWKLSKSSRRGGMDYGWSGCRSCGVLEEISNWISRWFKQ